MILLSMFPRALAECAVVCVRCLISELSLRLLVIGALAGCSAQVGGPGYSGVAPVAAEVNGMRFVLRLQADRAEAIRVSPMVPPHFETVALRAQRAVARASGCRPVWVVGDPSMLEIGLSCSGRPAPKPPKGRHTACDFLAAVGRYCD